MEVDTARKRKQYTGEEKLPLIIRITNHIRKHLWFASSSSLQGRRRAEEAGQNARELTSHGYHRSRYYQLDSEQHTADDTSPCDTLFRTFFVPFRTLSPGYRHQQKKLAVEFTAYPENGSEQNRYSPTHTRKR